MPTRNQHFVPRVYLKHWSPKNNENVFYYKKSNLEIGEPRNVTSILFKRHTYTITFESYFTLDHMPKIKEDFAEQIRVILQNYNAVAFYNNQELNTNELLSDPQNLGNLEQWSFQKVDCSNMLAPKKKIIANIKEIRSYVLEDALDDYVEKKWNDSLNKFLSQIENGYSLRIADEDIKVDLYVIESIISTLLLFMCRNPNFDCQGIFPRIENVLLNLLLENAKNEEEKKNILDFVSGLN